MSTVLIRRVIVVVNLHAITDLDGLDTTKGVRTIRNRFELPSPVARMRAFVQKDLDTSGQMIEAMVKIRVVLH